MRVTGLWWWIDRWRKSTAYTGMSLEEQGAYRNMLDEAALRGGAIPNDEEVLARACGDARRWRKVRAAVLERFQLGNDGWHNETLDQVIKESRKRAEKQRNYRNARGNASGNDSGNEVGNDAGNAGSPLPPLPPHTPLLPRSPYPGPVALSEKAPKELSRVRADDGMGPDERIREIAYELREIYPEVYAKCRGGARYATTHKTAPRDNPNYYAAAELHPDIQRLRALLEIFLTRPQFGDKASPGTPGQFVNMLPECDEILRRSGWRASA